MMSPTGADSKPHGFGREELKSSGLEVNPHLRKSVQHCEVTAEPSTLGIALGSFLDDAPHRYSLCSDS